MPRKYRRTCDWCGIYYQGEGKRYCGQECSIAASRAPDPDAPPTQPDETIHADLTDEGGSIYVEASRQIKSHEELIERAGIDPEEWQITSHPIRTWSVPLKIQDEIHVVQMYYVGLTLKPKLEQTWDLKPVRINVGPVTARPPHSGGFFTSVHYSDVHFPYQDDAALAVLYDVLADVQPDLVVCHGDLIDCESISRYPKDPYKRTSLAEEIRMGAEHLAKVTKLVPHAERWFLEGNHEERLRRLIWKMAEDRAVGELVTLTGMKDAMSWEKLLGLDSLGWEFTPYPKHRVLRDRLVLIHGDKARAKGYMARVFHDQYRKAGLSGHTHRIGSFYHTNYSGQVQAWHEIGCLCSIRDDYTSAPSWQQGLVVVSWDGDRYGVEHVSIHNGQAFFRGELYGARVAA